VPVDLPPLVIAKYVALSVVLPALVAIAVLWLARRWSGRADPTIGPTLGFLSGYLLLTDGLSTLPAKDPSRWLMVFSAVLMLFALTGILRRVKEGSELGDRLAHITMLVCAGGTLALLSPDVALQHVLVFGIAFIWYSVNVLLFSLSVPIHSSNLLILLFTLAPVLFIGGSARLGQFAACLFGATLGTSLFARRMPQLQLRNSVIYLCGMASLLALNGVAFASAEWPAFLVLVLIPLLSLVRPKARPLRALHRIAPYALAVVAVMIAIIQSPYRDMLIP
jgi:hypothetical protein